MIAQASLYSGAHFLIQGHNTWRIGGERQSPELQKIKCEASNFYHETTR